MSRRDTWDLSKKCECMNIGMPKKSWHSISSLARIGSKVATPQRIPESYFVTARDILCFTKAVLSCVEMQPFPLLSLRPALSYAGGGSHLELKVQGAAMTQKACPRPRARSEMRSCMIEAQSLWTCSIPQRVSGRGSHFTIISQPCCKALPFETRRSLCKGFTSPR